MQKLFFPTLLCFFILEEARAQFGNTPQVLTQSSNANQLGIWTADLDNDGDADLLCVHLNSLIWYENDGAGNFSNDHEIMTADMVNSIGFLTGAFEDLNADGLPDLVFDRAWRRNLGGGQFAPQTTILSNTLATLCDVDSDGRPDAITIEYTKFHWQRNLGNGSFGTRQTLRTVNGADVYNLKVDLDSDGRQDFFARHNNAFFWYKNMGNSQFDTVRLLSTFPGAVSVTDFEGNGKTDLLLGTGGQLFWYEYDSAGQPTLRQTLPQYHGNEINVGDLDADGDVDLFVGSVGTSNGHRARYFAFDAATGLFDPVPKNHNTYLYDHDYSEILDLNGDSQPDILVGTVVGSLHFGWLENLAPGSFSGFKNINRKFGLPYEIEIADLENDGDMDIFTVGIVLENLGGGQYAEKRPATPGTGSRAFSGDLDGDGVKDLALPLGDSISWRKGLGSGQFAAPKLLPGLVTSCKQVGGGDLDNDGDLDLFAANGTDAVIANARFYWFENDGAGNFTEHLLETGIQFCAAAFALDANEDGLLDMGLLFFNSYSPRVYLNLGGGNFAPPTGLFPAGTPSPSNVNQDLLTDLDGDGRLDYIYCTRNTSQTKVAWYQNLGAAGFSAEKSLATMAHQGSYAVPRFCVFDANLDGITDVVVSDNYWNRFLFVKGLGNSNFAQATTVYDEPNFGNFYGVAAHDVNGDGKLDIVYGSDTDYLYNFNGYNRLSWLANQHPAPAPALQIIYSNSTCQDNGTPLDATDDREVFRFNVVPIGDAAASGQYVLFDASGQNPLDTFHYGTPAIYVFPPGSAGFTGFSQITFSDLANPDLKKLFFKQGVSTCSPDAPPGIGITHLKTGCDDAGTPADPSDDRVRIELTAALYKGAPGQNYYSFQSSLGVPASVLDDTNIGFYTFPEVFLLPEGSATASGQLTLTLRDHLDTGIVRELVFDNPGTCATTPPPCPYEINYTKQSQIDLFPLTYPTCRVIEGEVWLRQSTLPGAALIENLNGFANLEIIRGSLDIDGTSLKNLAGLHNLDTLGGEFSLAENPLLQDFEGLNSLKYIGGSIWTYDLPALKSLDGLDSLNHLGGSLSLQTLPVLENLHALQNLTDVPGSLRLWYCDVLPSLAGLHHLTNVGTEGDSFSGQLVIADCPALENLAGLENLNAVSTLALQTNANLKNLSGLENLDTIRTGLSFFENHLLENLNALAGVKSALKGNITVRNNDALTELSGIGLLDFSMLQHLELTGSASLSGCAQPNICAYLEGGGAATIGSNESGCNSVAEVLAACSVGTVSASSGAGFQVFPNPLPHGEPLQILLENDFFGTVKIEILNLDGRVLQVFETEKTAHNVGEVLNLGDVPNAFFVRVSDGETSVTRLVLGF